MSTQEQLAGVKEGDVLAGKYRVDTVLGVGGMGVVVAAHHLQLDDRVAIKFLLPESLGNKEAVARFAREARAAVKIKSEHVARVTDVGTLESGAPYMVMEYLEGGDLSGWITERGALPVEQAVEFVLQACEAIAEAHALGIVHRDLKPANLFVARLPGGVQSVKVLDFGISKVTGLSASGGRSSATKTSALMGSPLYMSPEQMQSSKDVDARGDIWALGVILYELVTGVSPFIADSMPELILKIMQSPPPPLGTHRPDAPGGLEAVILRCLEKDRGRRYQTVGELAAALLPFGPKRARNSVDRIFQVMQAAGMSASALALPPSSDKKEEQPPGATAASWGTTTPGKSRGPWMVGAGLGVAIALGAAVTLLRKPSPGIAAASSLAVSSVPPAQAADTSQLPKATAPEPTPSNSVEASPKPNVPVVSPSSIPMNPSGGAAAGPSTGKVKKSPMSKSTKTAASPVVTPAGHPGAPPPTAVPAAPPPKPAKHTDQWGEGRL